MATGSEINEYINEIWYQFDHILKRCRQDSQVLVSHGVKETCEKSLRRLGQLLAFLGGAGELVNDALELIQNVGDLFDRLSDRRNQASQFNDFTKGFKLIENQAEELMTRGHRVGVDGPLVGLEKDVQLVTSQLLQNEVDRGLVSIVGAKGVGKTVLAREVYNNSDIVGQFQMRAWVRVPREFESNSVQLDIAMQVLPFEELKTVYSPTTMISCLRDILRKRRYLIVLDDIETLVAWKSLEKSLPDTSNCSRILITTRNRDLIDLIDHGPSRRVFEKWQLSEEYSWKLFKVRVGSRVSTAQQEFWRVAVSKCMGLPSAIYAVADEAIQSAVPQQIQHDQSAVPQQIQHDQSAVQQQDPINFADALPPYLQQWLVYLGFFPEEYQVPARRLIAYWVSGGQMQQNTEPESQELFAEKHLRDFGRANIIQVVKRRTNGNVKRCRISHILRHNWLSRAKNASSCTLNSNSAISTSSSPGMMSSSPGMMLQLNDRWLSKAKNAISRTLNSNAAISTSSSPGMMLQLIDRFDEEDDFFSHIHGNRIISKSSLKRIYQNLSCFISLDYREGPSPGNEVGNFFRECIAAGCFKVLQFVDLERVFQPNLPDSIGTLAKLRYLSLRWTYLETLPSSIGNLLELQTLDLKYTNISSLPSFLWKMGQLRRLYLNGNFRSTLESPASTSIVTEIQTLWGAYLNEETLIKNALDRLVNIRKLGLTCSLGPSKLKELAEWITELDELESLRLRLIDHEAVQASDIYLNSLSGLKKLSIIYLFGRLQNQVIVEDFPESLTEITLSFSELSEDPMPNLEKLPNLTTLKLLAGSYSGQSMHCSLRGFPLLQVLKLWCLQSLEEWIVETGAMKILRELEIRSCNELRVIPDGFEHLINCHELKITDMPDTFKARIIENKGEDWYKIKHMSVVQCDIADRVNSAN